ncbi:suppressor of fused domain protein [Pedobacter psychrodurus]|uniref:suppressor of fused domain protein n=1 Tax=Pedobacter psychrodurus TaxID=2530456 RepID=UPI00292FD5C0|nr:suppressor of fused domain protein [Pedobacter psychrodurus]
MSLLKKLFSPGKEKIPVSEVLLEFRSPGCPITAIVEQDERVAYFYLWGDKDTSFGVKSCWIRNLTTAPVNIETDLIKKGIPPMLSSSFCKYPQGQTPLNSEDLEIVWLEEGDGAALLEKGEIIAIIPAWSGNGDFCGYARDCKDHGEFCWELTTTTELINRVKSAQEYWCLWDNDQTPFEIKQPQLLNSYVEILGNSDRYYAIDGNEWPPKGLFLKTGDFNDVFVTVGLSLLPMPVVEMYSENPEQINRIELGLILKSGLQQTELDKLGGWISGQADIPWKGITWLGNGHTVTFKELKNTKITAVILVKDLNVLPKFALDDYRGSPINVLWMIPITENERNHVIENGCETLIEKLNSIGTEVFNVYRPEIILN